MGNRARHSGILMLDVVGMTLALLVCLLAACRGKAPDGPIASLWSWSAADQPYLQLEANGTVTHRGSPVAQLDFDRAMFTMPGLVDDPAPYDVLGPATREDGWIWVQFMRPRFGLGPDGSVLGAKDEGLEPDTIAPWGRLEPLDAPEPAKVGLLLVALLFDPADLITAHVSLRDLDPWACSQDIEVEATALSDGRIVASPGCPAWQACDVGPTIGRWTPDGRVTLDGLLDDVATEGFFGIDERGARTVTPVGQTMPWFVGSGSSFQPPRRGRIDWVRHSGRLFVHHYGPQPDDSFAHPAARAVALAVVTSLASRWDAAVTECQANIPPPPPPPPPGQ